MSEHLTASWLDESYLPQRGDRVLVYEGDASQPPYSLITVARVARDGSWADLRVRTADGAWTKRLPLPWRIRWAYLASPTLDDADLPLWSFEGGAGA